MPPRKEFAPIPAKFTITRYDAGFLHLQGRMNVDTSTPDTAILAVAIAPKSHSRPL